MCKRYSPPPRKKIKRPAGRFLFRYKMFDDISDLEETLIPTPATFRNFVKGAADELRVPRMIVVGGAVRDCVLGYISKRQTMPKDLDVILPAPLTDIEKNPNIVGYRKNSLGGMKVETKNFGTIDVFQQYTENPEIIIAKYFDFNCNSLFYRMRDNKIVASAFFYEFLDSRTIRQQHVFYGKDDVTCLYGKPQTVMRALKFQINFMENYNIKTNLSSDLLYMIYNMTPGEEEAMKKYMESHCKNEKLQNQIWQNYRGIKK